MAEKIQGRLVPTANEALHDLERKTRDDISNTLCKKPSSYIWRNTKPVILSFLSED